MKGWKLQRPAGPNGYWEILDEEGNSIATLYGGADDKEIERKATLMVNAERMFESLISIKEHTEKSDLNTSFYHGLKKDTDKVIHLAEKAIQNATNN